ncbi:polysaccharide biosynthesis/export family protein [Corallincola luteus]|uniref:polysaccharide biosynthesis/export family protein n=1 Tax=Corallincola luteus TaxID=1775177 RepID=UPI001F10A9DE|nr:polysaccharide biosynthesis/export family protein [Corallincola luteus]
MSPLNVFANTSLENYQLGAGDEIRIHVFGEEELSVETTLGQNGKINYPYLGSVLAKGKTTQELGELIADGLRGDYLINPSVLVSIIEYRAFYIYGEVNKPGGYPFQPGLTLEKAVALAGGFTQRASTDKFELSRQDGDGKKTIVATLVTKIRPGDAILVKDSFF